MPGVNLDPMGYAPTSPKISRGGSRAVDERRHDEGDHLLVLEGGGFTYLSVPPLLSRSVAEEGKLCFLDHRVETWDPVSEMCCLREAGHVHAHVHRGEITEDVLLEQCMEEAGCTLPMPWDLGSMLTPISSGDQYESDHEHQEGCGHNRIAHGDHYDWLIPLKDGSYVLSHAQATANGGSQLIEHGRLVKVGESLGQLKRRPKQLVNLFTYEGPKRNGYQSLPIDELPGMIETEIVGMVKSPPNSCMPLSSPKQAVVQEDLQIKIPRGFNGQGMTKTTFDVMGICCPSEVPLVKKILGPLPGVEEVLVNPTTKTVTVLHDPTIIADVQLVKILNEARLDASIHQRGRRRIPHKWPSPWTIGSGILLAVGGAIALGDYVEAGSIAFLFTLADWLESRSSDKARDAISNVADLAPQTAVLMDGQRVSVEEISLGTLLAVKAGELIPIDGEVVSGKSSVDESNVTGESKPVEKTTGAVVWAGTMNLSGYISVKTTALAEDSAVARMVRLVEEAQNQHSPMEHLVEKVAKFYTPFVVVSAVLIAAIPWAAGSNRPKHWIYLALVLLVVACPCALVISTPVTTTCGIAQAARAGLLVRGGRHLEALAKVKVVAMDKTGTLTEGHFRVLDVTPVDENANIQQILYWIACVESKASHPLAPALVAYARLQGVEPTGDITDFEIIPGTGVSALVDGNRVQIGNARLAATFVGFQDLKSGVVDTWSSLGATVGWVGVDGRQVGVFAVADSLRAEAREAVASLKKLGLEVVMLSGDSSAAAEAAHNQLGDIEVHAELLPEDKVTLVKTLKAHKVIAMVGDGINDAPALALANVGIAMGVAGSAVAMETADVALMTNDLRKLGVAIKLGRNVRTKIIQNVSLSFLTKITIIVLAAAGHPSLWAAVLADVGTCLVVIFNSMRLLNRKKGVVLPKFESRKHHEHKHGHLNHLHGDCHHDIDYNRHHQHHQELGKIHSNTHSHHHDHHHQEVGNKDDNHHKHHHELGKSGDDDHHHHHHHGVKMLCWPGHQHVHCPQDNQMVVSSEKILTCQPNKGSSKAKHRFSSLLGTSKSRNCSGENCCPDTAVNLGQDAKCCSRSKKIERPVLGTTAANDCCTETAVDNRCCSDMGDSLNSHKCCMAAGQNTKSSSKVSQQVQSSPFAAPGSRQCCSGPDLEKKCCSSSGTSLNLASDLGSRQCCSGVDLVNRRCPSPVTKRAAPSQLDGHLAALHNQGHHHCHNEGSKHASGGMISCSPHLEICIDDPIGSLGSCCEKGSPGSPRVISRESRMKECCLRDLSQLPPDRHGNQETDSCCFTTDCSQGTFPRACGSLLAEEADLVFLDGDLAKAHVETATADNYSGCGLPKCLDHSKCGTEALAHSPLRDLTSFTQPVSPI